MSATITGFSWRPARHDGRQKALQLARSAFLPYISCLLSLCWHRYVICVCCRLLSLLVLAWLAVGDRQATGMSSTLWAGGDLATCCREAPAATAERLQKAVGGENRGVSCCSPNVPPRHPRKARGCDRFKAAKYSTTSALRQLRRYDDVGLSACLATAGRETSMRARRVVDRRPVTHVTLLQGAEYCRAWLRRRASTMTA